MYAIPGGSTATATAMEDAHRFGYVSPWATTGTGIMNSSTGTTGSSTPHPFPSPTVKPYSVILNSNNTTNIGRASGTSSATNNDTPMPHGPSQFPFVTGTPPFAFATPTGNGIGIGIHPPMPQSHRLSSHSQTTPAPTATPVVVDVAVVATANSTATTATASTTSNATTKPVRRPAANLVLSDHPCQAPSPFAQTHSLVVVNTTEDTLNTSSNKSRIVVLVKSATDASFGITVQLDMVSGLVERNTTNGDPPPHKASVFRPHPSATAPPTPHGSTDNSSSSSRMVSVAPSAATVHAPPAGETQPGSLSAHNPESTANASLASFSQEPTISKAAMESTTGTVKGAAAAASLVVPKKQRRERRRRVFFAVMTVSDPSVQNQRLQELAASKPEAQATQQSIFLLQEGDIILTIGGKPTAGLPFVDACRLFRETCSASAVDDNGMIQCPITIARRRAPPQPLAALPLSSLAMTAPPAKKTTAVPRNPIVLKGPLQPLEIKAFCMTILAATTNPDRILGEPLFSFNVFAREWPQPELSGRGGVFQLDLLWKDSLCSSVEFIAKQQAMRHWKEQWTLEPVAVKNSLPAQNDVNPVSTHAGIKNKEYYTDAQRAVLRFAKRKPNQCRCKSTDHIYVNDVRCPLYSNLRRYLENNDSLVGTVSKENVNVSAWNAPDLSTVVPKAQRAVGDLLDREWKTVDKACKDRFVRVRAEQKAKDIQTEFVFMMEDIQLKHCKQASLAPSLAAMVLSAVVELQSEFAGRDLTPWTKTASVAKVDATSPSPPTESGPTEASIDDDSDDDDDIPLSALGKRPFEEEAPKATSEEYQNSPVRLQFVARILQLISSKWGHLYREPNHADYVWYVTKFRC